MGLFTKKPSKNKIYTLAEAMEYIAKNPNYSVVETTNGYQIMPDEMAKSQIEKYKEQNRFKNQISGNGEYKGIRVENYKQNVSARNYNSYIR